MSVFFYRSLFVMTFFLGIVWMPQALGQDASECTASKENAPVEDRLNTVKFCISKFKETLEKLRTSDDPALSKYDAMDTMLEEHVRGLMEIGIILAEDGPARSGLNDLEFAIKDQKSRISRLPSDTSPAVISKLEEAIGIDEGRQKKLSGDLGGLRQSVGEQIKKITNQRPVIIAYLKANYISEALSKLELTFSEIEGIVDQTKTLTEAIKQSDPDVRSGRN